MRASAQIGSVVLLAATSAMAIDLGPLWDFSKPEVSEQRFRQALEASKGDDALVLQTQIARTYGLRKDFERARVLLRQIETKLATAGAEPRVRYALEWGRTFASATHPPELQTPENKERARSSFQTALELARTEHLDSLAIDAIHMLAFVDTAPADQLNWAQEALAVTVASSQPAARQWEAAIRNNLGYALHQLERYEEALSQFKQAVSLRERGANAGATRVAHWMVAWTLRALNRSDEALAIQLRLEKENDAAGEPDRYVFEELEALYRARNDVARAEHYASRRRALGQ